MDNPPFRLGVEIEGNFSLFKEAEIWLKFLDFPEEKLFKGTIDTGSYYSLVPEGLPNRIIPNPEIKRHSE